MRAATVVRVLQDFLAFGENCSEICRATHRLSAATKIYPSDCTGDMCYGVIHWGYRRGGSVKPMYCIHTFSTVLTHAVH